MKDTLILYKFNTIPVNGTFNLLEERTFFGSKMMEIEDTIKIDKTSIQYNQYWIDTNINTGSTYMELSKNNGFQNYVFNQSLEDVFIQDLVLLKLDNHTIKKFQQSDIDLKNNTRWEITLDIKNILKTYLFYRIKEARTFKGLNYNNFINNSINNSIYDYITLNVMDRYKFDSLDLYVQYQKINLNNNLYNLSALLQYDPRFDSSVEISQNKVTNSNVQQGDVVDQLSNVKLIYNQTKPSTEYKFDYYFNIWFKKI